MAHEETSQLGVVEEIIASEELAVVKAAIFLTTSQCGGEHKSNTNRPKKKERKKGLDRCKYSKKQCNSSNTRVTGYPNQWLKSLIILQESEEL